MLDPGSGAFWWRSFGTSASAFRSANPARYLSALTIRVSGERIITFGVDSRLEIQWSTNKVQSVDLGWAVAEKALREQPSLAYMDFHEGPRWGRRLILLDNTPGDSLLGHGFNLPPGREMSAQPPGKAAIEDVTYVNGLWRVRLRGASTARATIVLNDNFDVVKVAR